MQKKKWAMNTRCCKSLRCVDELCGFSEQQSQPANQKGSIKAEKGLLISLLGTHYKNSVFVVVVWKTKACFGYIICTVLYLMYMAWCLWGNLIKMQYNTQFFSLPNKTSHASGCLKGIHYEFATMAYSPVFE